MPTSKGKCSILWENNHVDVDYSLVTFSGDGSIILVLYKDNELQLLSAASGHPIGQSWPVSDSDDQTPWILDISLNHSGSIAMAASTDGDVRLWYLDRRDQDSWKQTLRVVDNGVLAKAVLSPNGLIIAAVSRLIITGSQPQHFVTTLNIVKLTATGEIVGRSVMSPYDPWDRFISAGFSNDSRVLAAITLKKRVLEIEMDNGSCYWNPDLNHMTQPEGVEKDPGRSTVCFSPNDSSIVTTLGPSIMTWNRSEDSVLLDESIECEVRTPYTPILCSYSKGGDMLAISFDSHIKIFRTRTKLSLPISSHFLEGAFIRAMFFDEKRLYLLVNLASDMQALRCCYTDVAVSVS